MTQYASKDKWGLFPELESGDYWWDQRYADAISPYREAFVQHNRASQILLTFRQINAGRTGLDLVEAAVGVYTVIPSMIAAHLADYHEAAHARKVLKRFIRTYGPEV